MADTTVKRRNRPNRYSDELLLDAAAEVFDERGFAEASMVDIASRAGVTKPTLYARFGSKEALYDCVLERLAQSLVQSLTVAYEGVEGDSPEDATRRPVRAFLRWVRSNPVGFRLLLAPDRGAPTGVDHGERALATITDVATSATATFLRSRGLRPGRATPLIAAFLVGLLHQGASWAVAHDAFDELDVEALTATFVFSGLRGVDPRVSRSRLRRPRAT